MTGRSLSLLLAVSALWGVPYLLIKVAVDDGVAPGQLVWVRCAVGALVLVPFAWRAGAFGPLRRRWRAIAVLGVLDMAVPFVLLAEAEARVSSSLAGILVASVPLLIAVLAWRLVPEERVGGLRLAGLLTGFAGVALLMGIESGRGVSGLSSAALVLGASLSYAAATLYLRTKLRDAPALGVVTGALLTATVLTSPLAVMETSSRGLPSDVSLAVLVALGVFCSGVAFHLYYLLVAEAGAARAALNTYLSPAIAVCSGVLVLGEPLEAGMVAGLLLVLAGCWLTAGGPPPQSRLALPRPPRSAAARAGKRVRRWNMTSIGGFQ